jgi:hypothetical protein
MQNGEVDSFWAQVKYRLDEAILAACGVSRIDELQSDARKFYDNWPC